MPAKLVQIRRGTTPEHSIFTGKQGEITVDLDKDTIVVHDGNIQGGFPLAREDMINVIDSVGIQQLKLTSNNETAGQVLTTDGNGNLLFADDSTDVPNSPIGGDLSGTIGNAQINPNTISINELNVTDGTAGQALFTDGNGNLSFNNVVTDPTLGGDLSGTTSNAQINVNAVGTNEIADNSVTGAKIAIGGDTAGDILYYNGTDYTRLPAGTAGQALVMNSGATAPEWGVSASGQEFVEDTFVADGIADTFSPLSQVAVSEESLLVFIDGVAQPSTAFTLPTETSITFSSPPAQNSNIRVLHLGTPVPIADLSADPTMGGDLSGLSSNAQIVANAVGTTELADGSVTNAKLAANSITSDKILLDVIVAEDLAANSVTFSELQDGAVRTSKLDDNAVNIAKLDVADGNAGDFLQTNGAGVLSFAAATSSGSLSGMQVFESLGGSDNSEQTWTKPTGVNRILYFVSGGGGTGGQGGSGAGGNGGASGATVIGVHDVSGISSLQLRVGTGGAPGTSQSQLHQASGFNSYLGDLVSGTGNLGQVGNEGTIATGGGGSGQTVGTALGGTFRIRGNSGTSGQSGPAGQGGYSFFAPFGRGGSGGGATSSTGNPSPGGRGEDGVVVIFEFA